MKSLGRYLFLGGLSLLIMSCVNDENKCPDGWTVLKGNDSQTDSIYFDVCIPPPYTPTDGGVDTSDGADGGADAAPADDDCSGCADGQYCDTTLDPPECLDPPTGQGETCESDADCAGYEASYCENMVSFSCLVQNCSLEANNCSEDYMCCDFAWLGLPTMCVLISLNEGGVCYEP